MYACISIISLCNVEDNIFLPYTIEQRSLLDRECSTSSDFFHSPNRQGCLCSAIYILALCFVVPKYTHPYKHTKPEVSRFLASFAQLRSWSSLPYLCGVFSNLPLTMLPHIIQNLKVIFPTLFVFVSESPLIDLMMFWFFQSSD